MKTEKTLLKAVVVFVISKDRKKVLLAVKAKKIGAGCRNGYGGGQEEGEDSFGAAVRETKAESGGKNGPWPWNRHRLHLA